MFQPQCTLPETSVMYVSATNTRSTLDILWGCLFTIIACSWTVLQMNVPEQREGRYGQNSELLSKKLWGDIKWAAKNGFVKVQWMILTIFMPEMILGGALDTFLTVRSTREGFRDLGEDVRRQWTIVHIYYAAMGGFVLRDDVTDESSSSLTEAKVVLERIKPQENCAPRLDAESNSMAGFKSDAMQEEVESVEIAPHVPSNGPCHPCENTTPLWSADADFELLLPTSNGHPYAPLQLPDTTEQRNLITTQSSHYSVTLSAVSTEDTDSLREHATGRPFDQANIAVTNSHEDVERAAVRLESYNVPYHLRAESLLSAISRGLLPKDPPITEEEINDKSKSDAFGKTVAMLQIAWFCFNVIVRAVKKLGLSQLEVAVAAFSACSVVTYILYFEKPKSIATATTIKRYHGRIPGEIIDLQAELTKPRDTLEANRKGLPVPNETSTIVDFNPNSYGVWAGSVIFGAIHVAGWNLDFPTYSGCIAWRCAALITTVALPLGAFLVKIVSILAGEDHQRMKNIGEIAIIVGSLIAYILARWVLIIEMFRGMFYLPPTAFISTWTSNAPHI